MGRTVVILIASLAVATAVLGMGLVWSFRTGFAPVQDVIRRVNRRVFNPMQLRTAGQPGAYASVVHHVGRSSGTPYRTPVVAVPDGDDALLIALPYGDGTDWVRNVMAAGGATIEHEGDTVVMTAPRVLHGTEPNARFPAKEQASHRRFGVDAFLRLERPAG